MSATVPRVALTDLPAGEYAVPLFHEGKSVASRRPIWLAEPGPTDPLDRLRAMVASQLKLIRSTPVIPAQYGGQEIKTKPLAGRP